MTLKELQTLEKRLVTLRTEIDDPKMPVWEFEPRLAEINMINRKLQDVYHHPERELPGRLSAAEQAVMSQELDRAIALEEMGIPHLATRRQNKLRLFLK